MAQLQFAEVGAALAQGVRGEDEDRVLDDVGSQVDLALTTFFDSLLYLLVDGQVNTPEVSVEVR